ncbi:MAG: SDR family NAD(P)-dependent oxidoreductase [Mycobacteriales bacterium]
MNTLRDKTILITGGTGSFGNAMVRRAIESGATEVRILSRDEAKQDAMRASYRDPRLRFYVGDVRDSTSVSGACRKVDYVFHAAALKQVPSCEFFPMQAVQTNIVGSENVIQAATLHECEAVVMLSTDKAVQAVNAMGMTKALMEKLMIAQARLTLDTRTRICGVRYGNVLYSRGSVVPAFVQACKNGVPMRVTDRSMTRFLLPLRVAVELVEDALASASAGDLLVRKAPAATMDVLSRAVATMMGVEVNTEEIGVRHGEKIHETLATREELQRSQEFESFFKIGMDDRDLNYSLYVSEGQPTSTMVDYTSENTVRVGLEECVELLSAQPELKGLLKGNGIR